MAICMSKDEAIQESPQQHQDPIPEAVIQELPQQMSIKEVKIGFQGLLPDQWGFFFIPNSKSAMKTARKAILRARTLAVHQEQELQESDIQRAQELQGLVPEGWVSGEYEEEEEVQDVTIQKEVQVQDVV